MFLQSVWTNPLKNISVNCRYLYCFLTTQKVRQKYCLFVQNLFIEFPQFWKKNRHSWSLTNSSKTFLNQWEPMGFHKLQWMILPAWRASNISSLIWQLGSKWFFMRSKFIGTMLRFPLKPPFNISENFVFEETLILTNWTVCWTTLILLMVGENPIFNICMRKQAKLASN